MRKEETYNAYALMTYSSQCELITFSLREITYQSFGLYKKQHLQKQVLFFGVGKGIRTFDLQCHKLAL